MGAAGLNSLRKDPPYPLYESMYRSNVSRSVYPIENNSIQRSPVYLPDQRPPVYLPDQRIPVISHQGISQPYYDDSFPVILNIKEEEPDEDDQYDARFFFYILINDHRRIIIF